MIIQPQYTNFVISFSFKNYLRAKSGMPKVILSHQITINSDKVSYVYLYSVKKTIHDDNRMLFCFYGLIIDGVDYGVFTIGKIIKLFQRWIAMGYNAVNIHIHHLLFTDIKKIELLLDEFSDVQIKFFLHDYYLCCKSYHLLNKAGEYCKSKSLSSEACNKCEFYRDSLLHENNLHGIVSKYFNRVEFISPSEATKDIYIGFWPQIKKYIKVLPHQKFVGEYHGNSALLEQCGVIRIGYLGVSENYKGWDVWSGLVDKYKDNDKYEFYVFNNRDQNYGNMHHVFVEFSSEKQNAMVEAVRDNRIDIVLFWTRVPETYSYTCMEAYAANAYIITNSISGNVQDFVNRQKAGIVLDEAHEVEILFNNSSKLREMVNEYRSTKTPSPLDLVDNDDICELYREYKIVERSDLGEYHVHKPIWAKGIEYLYDHFVQKY